MATTKKTPLEKVLGKFNSLIQDIKEEQRKMEADLPTMMLYKRLLTQLNQANRVIQADKANVERIQDAMKKNQG